MPATQHMPTGMLPVVEEIWLMRCEVGTGSSVLMSSSHAAAGTVMLERQNKGESRSAAVLDFDGA